MTILAFLTRPFGRWLALGLAAIAILAWLRWDAVQDAETARIIEDQQDYIEGTKDARDATKDLPDTDDGNRDWLCRFAGGGPC